MEHRKYIVDAAIQGLQEGGMSVLESENLRKLFDRIYESAYNEGLRCQYVTMLGSPYYRT